MIVTVPQPAEIIIDTEEIAQFSGYIWCTGMNHPTVGKYDVACAWVKYLLIGTFLLAIIFGNRNRCAMGSGYNTERAVIIG